MNIKIEILIIIIISATSLNDCFPQNIDSLKKGSYYSFTLNDGKTIQGKVISADSFVALLNTKNGMYELNRKLIVKVKKLTDENILEYLTSYRKEVYNKFLSLSAGAVMPESNEERSSPDLYDGFSISASYFKLIDRTFGIKTGFTYSNMKNKDLVYSDYYYENKFSGGNLSQFLIQFQLLAGMFHPEKKINYYFQFGIGFGYMKSSDIKSSNLNYSYYNGNYNGNELQFMFSYGFGGGVTYRISDKLALKTEITYDSIIPDEGFFDKMNQFGISAGIIFINF